ncbi:hypothetical protein [Hymenobacter sp. BT190]|uniref:hypothetical protein n=1 Tax=Hymenobacter sp. BT190 TaxID=2763505 RepID=UPI00165156A2|nr:hypothetical protein [Hymenobacter sp. BT190]
MTERIAALSALRKQIPVGAEEGLRLLAETNGDIVAAVAQFKAEKLVLILAKTGADASFCQQCLKANCFDIRQTLVQIENSQYSVSERVFRKYKWPAQALSKLALVVEQATQLQRKYWLTAAELAILNKPQYALLLVQEWIMYEEWEDFSAALSFEIEAVIEVFEQELKLPAVAANLCAASQRSQKIKLTTSYQEAFRQKGYAPEDPEIQQYEVVYQSQRALIDESLYRYALARIALFP